MKKTNALKLIAFIMCISLILSFVSCGDIETNIDSTTQTTAPALSPDAIAFSKIRFVKGEYGWDAHNNCLSYKYSYQVSLITSVKNDSEFLAAWDQYLAYAKDIDGMSGDSMLYKTEGCIRITVITSASSDVIMDKIGKIGNFKYDHSGELLYDTENSLHRIYFEVKYEDVDLEAVKKLALDDEIIGIDFFVNSLMKTPG